MDKVNSSFNEALSSEDNYKAWYDQGVAQANSGSYHEALASCDKALAIESQDAACWVLRGVVLIHLERYSEALASCEKAVAIDPNHQEAWLIRGAALNHLGRYKQSYASYDKAVGVKQTGWQRLSQMFKRNFLTVTLLG